MKQQCILTIAVPTFNMERWLEKNLATYQDERLFNRLEVICLNNASEDSSQQIIRRYVKETPQIFRLFDRDSRGYGSSINAAIEAANGEYFRIVDADDWVDTCELIKLVDKLEVCRADVVLTDYQIVNMQSRETTAVRASDKGISYDILLKSFSGPKRTLPSIHCTTYRTKLLRSSKFRMQDKMFFVDEEYVILPYLNAKTVIYYPFDIYRYQVANPSQSTSPKNRAKYLVHREQVLRRLILAYQEAKQRGANQNALDYCFERIKRGVGDHFTTLYMYVGERREGRMLASQWKTYLRTEALEFWAPARKKVLCLACLNRLHVTIGLYERLKKQGLKILSAIRKRAAYG